MTISKPNRTNVQSSNAMEVQKQKNSGDQHVLPIDEPAEDPYRPHRVSRHDMDKTFPKAKEPDKGESP